MLFAVFFSGCILFALAYRFYGRFLSKEMDLDDGRPTPANTMRDGVDYVASPDPVLFGHHFSTIAGAGPILGPIIAALAFGWVPAVLWIVIGTILIGGVHDFSVMVASIRNCGRSIGRIGRDFLSPTAYYLLLLFILLTLIYVIIVFMDITADTFIPSAGAVAAGGEQLVHEMQQGGAVASASVIYVALAVLFGLCIYKLKLSVKLGSLIFVPLVFAGLWFGSIFPLTADLIPAVAGSVKNFWSIMLCIYCLFAAMLPVWVLLQPRDYLASFLLYACLTGGVAGLVAAGISGNAALNYPAFITLYDANLGWIFPALFITIACGAVSGFHSIVASGTSAKQLSKERSALRIGYGSMLVESVLALLAVATVMIIAGSAPAGETPVVTFGKGLGIFGETLGVPAAFTRTFAMLAVSTFLLTTLDSCTRLARFLFEEMTGIGNSVFKRFISTVTVLILPVIMIFQKFPGPDGTSIPAWQAIWPVFGACNQLLAALALLIVYLWLRHSGKRAVYILLPMIFMFITTLTALLQMAWKNLMVKDAGGFDVRWISGGVSLLLAVIAMIVLIDSARMYKKPAQNSLSS
ncbi:MAG: carbon starvation CstA family protein [Kiritimatiellales bacterium]